MSFTIEYSIKDRAASLTEPEVSCEYGIYDQTGLGTVKLFGDMKLDANLDIIAAMAGEDGFGTRD